MSHRWSASGAGPTKWGQRRAAMWNAHTHTHGEHVSCWRCAFACSCVAVCLRRLVVGQRTGDRHTVQSSATQPTRPDQSWQSENTVHPNRKRKIAPTVAHSQHTSSLVSRSEISRFHQILVMHRVSPSLACRLASSASSARVRVSSSTFVIVPSSSSSSSLRYGRIRSFSQSTQPTSTSQSQQESSQQEQQQQQSQQTNHQDQNENQSIQLDSKWNRIAEIVGGIAGLYCTAQNTPNTEHSGIAAQHTPA